MEQKLNFPVLHFVQSHGCPSLSGRTMGQPVCLAQRRAVTNYSFSPLFSAKESSARRRFCPGSLAWATQSCAMLACQVGTMGMLPGSWGDLGERLGLCSPRERKGSWSLCGKSSLCTAGVLSPGWQGAVQPAPPGFG